MANGVSINLSQEQLLFGAALLGFAAGTKTPGFVDRKLESAARQFGLYAGQGMAQAGHTAAYMPIGGASESRGYQTGDPLNRLYEVVSVLAKQQGEAVEILKALKDYLPQNGK